MIRVGLDEEHSSDEEFEDLLMDVGYLDIHAHIYSQTGYTERQTHFYQVGPGFPRLVEDDLRPGVGDVRYQIDASACLPFEVDASRVATWLKESPPPADPLQLEESQHLEFKATAWKSINNPNIPDKVINEGILKSVAGFLNSDGGTLIIGVEDRANSLVGIETDLEHLGIDLDAYENRLTTMIFEAIGQAVTNTRLSFDQRPDGTICTVAVRASARPVFAKSTNSKNNKKVFWVRMNNSTRELDSQELVDYIREHWG